jgi:hypothetical protein
MQNTTKQFHPEFVKARTMRKFFAICLTFLMPTLSAYTAPCPGEFGFSSEWLYMAPAYDQPYFVVNPLVTTGDTRIAKLPFRVSD